MTLLRSHALLSVSAFFFAQTAGAQNSANPSFIKDVAPILRENCFGCHGSKNPKGKLDLTKYEAMRKGGTKDDPIVPGKPDDSYLIDVMKATDKMRMPPKDNGDPVPPAQMKIIETWITQGAKLDPEVAPKADLVRELRQRWNPPALVAKYPFPIPVTAITHSPDGKKIVTSGHHELMIWDVDSGKLEKRIAIRPRRVMSMAFLDANQLAVAGGRPGEEGTLAVYNISAPPVKTENSIQILDGTKSGKALVRQLADADDELEALAISNDRKKLAAAGCDRAIQVWDISKGIAEAKLEQTIENHADWIFGLAFSADGKTILSASRDKTAKLWDLGAKESLATFPDHATTVYAVLALPDGKLGLSAGEDNQVRSWQLQGDNAGKQDRAKGGHGGAVFRMAWMPGQKEYVTASSDQTVRIWKVDNGDQVKAFPSSGEQVLSLSVSPDGKQIVGGTFSGEILIWNSADTKLIRKFASDPGQPTPVVPPIPQPAPKKEEPKKEEKKAPTKVEQNKDAAKKTAEKPK